MMKKAVGTLCVFFLFSIFVFTGCGSIKNSESCEIKTDFSAEFSAEYRNESYTGTISSNRQGVAGINISSPEEVGGINFKYKNGGLEISREDLLCSADEAYLPPKSFPSLVKSILGGISQGRAKLSSQNKEYLTYSLRTDSGDCFIKTELDGKIMNAEIKDAEIELDFSNVKLPEN